MITIRMPADLRTKWLEALRSGKYPQCRGELEDEIANDGTRGYCCLGVLQLVADGQTEYQKTAGLPSDEWLASHLVTFTDSRGNTSSLEPWLPTLQRTASAANDGDTFGSSYTFAEIANAVEACSEPL